MASSLDSPTAASKDPWPTDLHLERDGTQLRVCFDDKSEAILSAELLRVESPSAEVQGHGPDQKKVIRDKADVKITAMEAVGRYAIRLNFDDGHDTGIYSWVLLHDYGQRKEDMMAAYKKQLSDNRQ